MQQVRGVVLTLREAFQEKGDVQLKIYNNNKQLKEFFVSDLSEIWYGESESQFHPPYQI